MAVEASIVVVFGEQEPGENDIVVVEFDPVHPFNLDAEMNLKTLFDPSDTPVFLLHHSNTLEVVDVLASSGSVSQIGTTIVQNRTSSVSFVKIGDTSSLGYDNLVTTTTAWMGNTGVATVKNGSELELTGGTPPCIGITSFPVTFQRQYMVTPPALTLLPDETYEILVVVYMEVIS
jgi:hypothetical protein